MNGKQLSDCLDSACNWPDTLPVVSFAKEAWQCVSRKGEINPNRGNCVLPACAFS